MTTRSASRSIDRRARDTAVGHEQADTSAKHHDKFNGYPSTCHQNRNDAGSPWSYRRRGNPNWPADVHTTRKAITMKTALLLAAAALAATTLSPVAADTYHPPVQPLEDMIARVDGLTAMDPRPFQDCVGLSCHIAFLALVDHEEYLCDMYSAAQAAVCVQIDGGKTAEGVLFDERFLRAGKDGSSLGGGQVEEGPSRERVEAAEVLPDRSRIAFDAGGDQIECWVDGPVVGCRTPQRHGFYMHHNGAGSF